MNNTNGDLYFTIISALNSVDIQSYVDGKILSDKVVIGISTIILIIFSIAWLTAFLIRKHLYNKEEKTCYDFWYDCFAITVTGIFLIVLVVFCLAVIAYNIWDIFTWEADPYNKLLNNILSMV